MSRGKQSSLALRIFTTILLTILATGLSVLGVLSYKATSQNSQPATCLSDRCFCEAPNPSGLSQSVGSITSLTFVIMGVWALFSWAQFKKKTKERPLVALLALTFIFIGLSSFFYHGTLSYLGQFLDVFSMYTFAILLFVGALFRSEKVSLRRAVILFIILNVVFGVLQYYYPDARRLLFGVLLIPGLVLEQLPSVTGFGWFSRQVRFFYLGAGLLTLAYVFWFLDESNIFCLPYSIFQGHGIWHILTALGVYTVILHYRQTSHALSKTKSY